MSAVKFGQLLEELSHFFSRVDVRFACFRQGDEWVNYASSIRFLCDGSTTVRRTKPIVTRCFRTYYASGTVEDDWKDFQQAFASGKVELQEVPVAIKPVPDIASLNCGLSRYSTYFIEKEWRNMAER